MRLLLVAGEVSGDQHGAALVDALRARVPQLELVGVGGDRCAERGLRLIAHQKDLAVVGLVEAIGKLRFARRLIQDLVAETRRERVDAAILIDSPDFNLPLAKRLHAAGVPVIFYVSPQVWAWRSGRAKKIARIGRAILVLFGFEKRWYEARGLGEKVTWVGHPLVDQAADELRSPVPRPEPGRGRVILMPGSRHGEILRNLPVMAQAAEKIVSSRPNVEIVLIKADSVSDSLLQEAAGDALTRWTLVSGPHLALLAASDVLVVASGTATVEGLLARIPMVVVYRVNGLTFFLARRLVRVPHIAMANIVSDLDTGLRTVPELIQHDATAEKIAQEVSRFLDDPALSQITRERLAAGAADLGAPGAAERTADAVLRALGVPDARSSVSILTAASIGEAPASHGESCAPGEDLQRKESA
ncbi:MAG: lipid-A-disaccharide synthase [Thermoanaerobaculia bacterium]